MGVVRGDGAYVRRRDAGRGGDDCGHTIGVGWRRALWRYGDVDAYRWVLGYRLYRAITTQADDPNGDFTLPQSRVWVAVPLGPLCYGFVHTGTQCGYPGSPPAADSTISPLYNAGTPLPDEGAALAAANGPMTGERYVSRSMDDYVTIVTISKAVMSFPDTLFSLDVGLAHDTVFRAGVHLGWRPCSVDPL